MSNEPQNTAIDLANYAARKVVMDVLLEGAEASARVSYPWLNFPVIKQFFNFTMNLAGEFILKKLTIETAVLIIGVQVSNQQHNYEAEVEQLKTAIKEGKSDEEIQREREETKKRLRVIINFSAG